MRGIKPIRYFLELFELLDGKPCLVAQFGALTPFMPLSVGERFDDTGWRRLDGSAPGSQEAPRRYTVHSVKHLVLERGGSLIYRYQVNLSPYAGPRSPLTS